MDDVGDVFHDAHGWWVAEAGPPGPRPPLRADANADVAVVGGGYTGLWAAWHAAARGAAVILLEAGRCGFGPSGRNGGFVSSLERHAAAGTPLAVAAEESVVAIGDWCAEHDVDAWYRPARHLECADPPLGGVVSERAGATVQPARLAFGLAERVRERGVRVHEHTPVVRIDADGTVSTPGGRVRAGAVLICAGAASGRLRPLRDRVLAGSSHIVITEPVPDVLAAIGWSDDVTVTDTHPLLHYARTTPDGRIAFGWAGGRMAVGTRLGGRLEVDAQAVSRVIATLQRWLPELAGRRMEHAWGGPVDVSPAHRPEIRTLAPGRVWAAYGYTGNGVGPAHLVGRSLAELALSGATPLDALVDPPARELPPEPLRSAGAAALRRALVAHQAIEARGDTPPAPLRMAVSLPERLGIRLVR